MWKRAAVEAVNLCKEVRFECGAKCGCSRTTKAQGEPATWILGAVKPSSEVPTRYRQGGGATKQGVCNEDRDGCRPITHRPREPSTERRPKRRGIVWMERVGNAVFLLAGRDAGAETSRNRSLSIKCVCVAHAWVWEWARVPHAPPPHPPPGQCRGRECGRYGANIPWTGHYLANAWCAPDLN